MEGTEAVADDDPWSPELWAAVHEAGQIMLANAGLAVPQQVPVLLEPPLQIPVQAQLPQPFQQLQLLQMPVDQHEHAAGDYNLPMHMGLPAALAAPGASAVPAMHAAQEAAPAATLVGTGPVYVLRSRQIYDPAQVRYELRRRPVFF